MLFISYYIYIYMYYISSNLCFGRAKVRRMIRLPVLICLLSLSAFCTKTNWNDIKDDVAPRR